jgi:hypothetical protein
MFRNSHLPGTGFTIVRLYAVYMETNSVEDFQILISIFNIYDKYTEYGEILDREYLFIYLNSYIRPNKHIILRLKLLKLHRTFYGHITFVIV